MNITEKITSLKQSLPSGVTLVAVSKTKPLADLEEAYKGGQRIFGENKIQEMTQKWESLPKDIEWHMIGHVQTNKVKFMAPYVHTIHAVDSLKLLKEVNKQAYKNDRAINCLLQVKIAKEDSKYGLSEADLASILESDVLPTLTHVKITGLMGMATFTEDQDQIKAEFKKLKVLFDEYKNKKLPVNTALKTLSMGMSGDYTIAVDCGSNMIRVGSSIFGARKYS